MIGKTILNFRIDSLIAEGGMGNVFLAYHIQLGTPVAVKALSSSLLQSEKEKERFRKEAQTLASMNHRNIVRFLHFLEDDEGLFIIMEYVQGYTLDEYITRFTGPVPESKAIEWMCILLEACRFAHAAAVIHRDIKPSNIIISESAGIKILDFGVAKLLDDNTSHKLTRTGSRIGTPMYMSPEQIRAAAVDNRSDIYSLGVVLHQLLTGIPPYDASSTSEFDLHLKIVQEPLPRAKAIYPHVSNRMQRIIDIATAKDPVHRYQNCDAFIAALKEKDDKGGGIMPEPIDPGGFASFVMSNIKWVAFVVTIFIGLVIAIPVLVHKNNVSRHNENYAKAMTFLETAQYDSTDFYFNRALEYLEADSTLAEKQKVSTFMDALQDFYGAKYDSAYTKFEKAAELGVAEAHYYIGELLFNGLGTDMDQVEGKKHTEKALELGFGMANWRMATIYKQGLAGDSINETKANEYYFKAFEALKKLAEAGDPEAQANLASMYGSGSGLEKNVDLEHTWLERAAESGYAFAQTSLGYFYIVEEKFRNGTMAEAWLKKAANKGDARGQYYLGQLYETNLLGSPNYNMAKEQYELAAAQGYAIAHTALGDLYFYGKGSIPEDNESARNHYLAAAEKNEPTALYRLGEIYLEGYGVIRDYREAFDYFMSAKKNGSVLAYNKLGFMYENGFGTIASFKDAVEHYVVAYVFGNENAMLRVAAMHYQLGTYSGYQAALKYYKILADKEEPNLMATTMLGLMYLQGKGTPKSCMEAARWFRKARELGSRDADQFIQYAESYRCNEN